MITHNLELSTCHITEETSKLMPKLMEQYVIYNTDYGWIIYVVDNDEDIATMPLDLVRLIQLAREKECRWLMLDCDAWVDDNLPKYEW